METQFNEGSIYYLKDQYYKDKMFRYTKQEGLEEISDTGEQIVFRNPKIEMVDKEVYTMYKEQDGQTTTDI